MFLRWLSFSVVLTTSLCGHIPVSLELDSTTLAHGCVNIFNGAFQQSHVDLQLRCSQPFSLCRSYSSDDPKRFITGVWHIAEEAIIVEQPHDPKFAASDYLPEN
jgi:hypothetical protein